MIYIGKSKNIKKRVNQHFTGTISKSIKIQKEVYAVTYEETGSELIALLKESEEIKINKPIYNRAQRKTIISIGHYIQKKMKDGYIALKVAKSRWSKKRNNFIYSPFKKAKMLYLELLKNTICVKK